jgi:hypothetical protein
MVGRNATLTNTDGNGFGGLLGLGNRLMAPGIRTLLRQDGGVFLSHPPPLSHFAALSNHVVVATTKFILKPFRIFECLHCV